MAEFSLRPSPDDYLLFFGRIHPDKGVVEAIEVAHRTARRLIIAGLIQDQPYFYEKVAPILTTAKSAILAWLSLASVMKFWGELMPCCT